GTPLPQAGWNGRGLMKGRKGRNGLKGVTPMVRRLHLVAISLLFCVVANSRAADMLDLIPGDALGGVACRSIEGLVAKSEKLVKDAEIKVAEVARPRELCKQVFMFLGITAGLETQGGGALVVVHPRRNSWGRALRVFCG